MKSLKLLPFFCLIIFINNAIKAQTDSLYGYSIFKFGQTKNEVIDILNKEKISFDTTKRFKNIDENIILFKDEVKLFYLKEYNFTVTLFFDKFNNYELYRAEIVFIENCDSIKKSDEIFNRIFDIYVQKYGSNFEMKDYTDSIKLSSYPKSKYYTWLKDNGYIRMRYDFSSFFEIDQENMIYTGKIKPYGIFQLYISYFDNISFNRWLDAHKKRIYEDEQKRKKEIEEKF
jgi:hypothetical protein